MIQDFDGSIQREKDIQVRTKHKEILNNTKVIIDIPDMVDDPARTMPEVRLPVEAARPPEFVAETYPAEDVDNTALGAAEFLDADKPTPEFELDAAAEV